MSNQTMKSLEDVILHQLKSLGYLNIEIKSVKEKSFNVIADGALRDIFLFVLIQFVSDKMTNELTNAKIKSIKKEAKNIEKEPWTAIMKVNENGELIENIQWKNLSKQPVV